MSKDISILRPVSLWSILVHHCSLLKAVIHGCALLLVVLGEIIYFSLTYHLRSGNYIVRFKIGAEMLYEWQHQPPYENITHHCMNHWRSGNYLCCKIWNWRLKCNVNNTINHITSFPSQSEIKHYHYHNCCGYIFLPLKPGAAMH